MAKGKNKIKGLTTGGIYQGDLGAAAAEANPRALFNHALANEGLTALNTAPDAWNYLQNQGFDAIFNGFQNSQVFDQNLNFYNHMATRYGTTPTMSASNPYYTAPAPAPAGVSQGLGGGGGGGGGKQRNRRRNRNPFGGNSVLGG